MKRILTGVLLGLLSLSSFAADIIPSNDSWSYENWPLSTGSNGGRVWFYQSGPLTVESLDTVRIAVPVRVRKGHLTTAFAVVDSSPVDGNFEWFIKRGGNITSEGITAGIDAAPDNTVDFPGSRLPTPMWVGNELQLVYTGSWTDRLRIYATFQAPAATDLNLVGVDSTGMNGVYIVTESREVTHYGTIENAFDAMTDGDSMYVIGSHTVTPDYCKHAGGTPPLLLDGIDNFEIKGFGGAHIYLPAADDTQGGCAIYLEDCTKGTIRDIKLSSDKPSMGLNGGSPFYTMIELAGTCTEIVFDNVRLLDGGGHGISHLHNDKSSRNITIQNCYFHDFGDPDAATGNASDGAAISGIGPGWKVIDSVFDTGDRGIEIEDSFAGVDSEDIIIARNTVNDQTNIGIMLFATGPVGDEFFDTIISENVISDCGWGIMVTGGERILCINNTVRDCVSQSIDFYTAHGPFKDCRISGNSIYNSGSAVGTYGIRAAGTTGGGVFENVVISDNTVIQSADSGILVRGSNISVIDNMVIDSGQAAGENAGIAVGVNFDTDSNEGYSYLITGNTIDSYIDPLGDEYGIWINGTGPANVIIYSNNIRHVKARDIYDTRTVLGVVNNYGHPMTWSHDMENDDMSGGGCWTWANQIPNTPTENGTPDWSGSGFLQQVGSSGDRSEYTVEGAFMHGVATVIMLVDFSLRGSNASGQELFRFYWQPSIVYRYFALEKQSTHEMEWWFYDSGEYSREAGTFQVLQGVKYWIVMRLDAFQTHKVGAVPTDAYAAISVYLEDGTLQEHHPVSDETWLAHLWGGITATGGNVLRIGESQTPGGQVTDFYHTFVFNRWLEDAELDLLPTEP